MTATPARRPPETAERPRYIDTPKPEPGEAIEVAAGVHWVRLPLPFKLDHVNIWLLDDGAGWTVVDTGLASEVNRDAWARLRRGVMAGRPITRIVVTHFHPDHVGLAGWLCAEDEAPLHMTRTEWLTARLLVADQGEAMTEMRLDYFRRAGCGADHLDYVRGLGAAYANRVTPPPCRYERLVDGQVLEVGGRRWAVVVGQGHSPEHACLFAPDARILIAGDQVLPRISPNVGVPPDSPDGDPLAGFLATLQRLRGLPEDTFVLPSHDTPFHGLHPRLAALAAHHAARLDSLAAECRAPRTAMELARVLFERPLDAHQMGFAIGETLAHLNHLRRQGRVRRETDGDGVWRYRAGA